MAEADDVRFLLGAVARLEEGQKRAEKDINELRRALDAEADKIEERAEKKIAASVDTVLAKLEGRVNTLAERYRWVVWIVTLLVGLAVSSYFGKPK